MASSRVASSRVASSRVASSRVQSLKRLGVRGSRYPRVGLRPLCRVHNKSAQRCFDQELICAPRAWHVRTTDPPRRSIAVSPTKQIKLEYRCCAEHKITNGKMRLMRPVQMRPFPEPTVPKTHSCVRRAIKRPNSRTTHGSRGVNLPNSATRNAHMSNRPGDTDLKTHAYSSTA